MSASPQARPLRLGHPEAPPGDTSAVIMKAALDMFADIGYGSTSMRDLARAVGIQPASLYNHFDSKESLLWGIVRRVMDELVRDLDDAFAADAESVPDRFRHVIHALVAFHAERGVHAQVVNRELRSLSVEHHAQAAAEREEVASRIRALIREGIDEGSFEVPDVQLATLAIISMAMGVSNWFRSTGPAQIDEVSALFASFALRVVGHHA